MHHGFGALIRFSLGFSLLVSFSAEAALPSVCARFTNRALHRKVSRDADSRFAFKNTGGILNQGVCWWHSRFQRSVWALGEFRPDLPKPSYGHAVRLIEGLAYLRGVQVIPGYGDFQSFSADFRPEIQAELNRWQIRDGVLNQSWLRGLRGKADLGRKPERMRAIMDDLYRYYVQGAVENFFPWIMLQLTGVDAHASMIVGMVRQRDGYLLEVVDSNFPEITTTWSYRYGDGQLGGAKYETVPYRGLHRDVTAIKKAWKRYCLPSSEKTSDWPDSTDETVDDLEPYLGNESAFQE